jgi:hypothetical protein
MTKYAETTLGVMVRRAKANGARFMTVDAVRSDLGAPVDFDDVLEELHARGLITLHRDCDALTLNVRG